MAEGDLKMAVKVNASVLGIKSPILVKESNRNIKLALKLQILMSQSSDKLSREDLSMEEQVLESIKLQDGIVDFISAILKLSDKQIDALEDLEQDETGDLLQDILSKIMHVDEDAEDGEEGKK